MLALAVAIRVWNAGAYDLRYQHDPQVHLGYLVALAASHVPPSYNAPWYYGLTCLLALPAIAAGTLLGADDRTLLRVSVGFANTVLFLGFMAGCLALGRRLGFEPAATRLYALLVCAFPVVARAFNMVRPENLILALTPWALVLLLRGAPDVLAGARPMRRAPDLWGIVLAQGVMVAQKLGGLTVVASLPAFLATIPGAGSSRRRVALVLGVSSMTVGVAAALIAAQAWLSGMTPLHHDRAGEPQFGRAPARFFLQFDPIAVWRDPFRDRHRESMPQILFIDLYGDYWRYGIDQPSLGRSERARVSRARLGLVAGAAFLALSAVSAGVLLAHGAPSREARSQPGTSPSLAAIAPLLASAAYLVGGALTFHDPADGDIAKWEYITWVFVFLPIPIVGAWRRLHGIPAVLHQWASLGLAGVGLVQSLVTRAF